MSTMRRFVRSHASRKYAVNVLNAPSQRNNHQMPRENLTQGSANDGSFSKNACASGVRKEKKNGTRSGIAASMANGRSSRRKMKQGFRTSATTCSPGSFRNSLMGYGESPVRAKPMRPKETMT